MHHAQSQELKHLVNFLNLKLTKKFELESGPSLQGAKFMRTHGGPLPEVAKAQTDIQFFLKAALQPEMFVKYYPRRRRLTPRQNVVSDEFSKKFEAQNLRMTADFKADPAHFLSALVDRANAAECKAQWILQQSPPAKSANIDLRGSRWLLKKYPNGGEGTVFHWFLRILEQGELSKLSCCHVCKGFFIRNRAWQVYCRDKCRTKHDNYQSAVRKAAQKGQRKKTQKAARVAEGRQETKDRLLSEFKSAAFLKRLPGGPNQKHTKQAELIALLARSRTVKDFLKDFRSTCDPKLHSLIDSVIQDNRYLQ